MAVAAETGSSSAVSAMMRSCRDLHRHGIRVLLAMDVSLRSHADHESYATFLEAHSGERAQLVKALYLRPVSPLPEDVVNRMVPLVRAMANVERVNIDGVKEHPDLLSAISSLTRLKHLVVLNFGAEASEMLRTLRAPLVSLSLIVHPVFLDYSVTVFPAVLRRQAPTLQTLRITRAQLRAPPATAEDPPLVFARVESLTVGDYLTSPATHLSLSACTHYFPNVKRLQLFYGYGWPRQVWDRLRGENRPAGEEARGWQTLQDIRGAVESLYMLNLRCQCDNLDVVIRRQGSVELLQHVLRDIAPRTFAIALNRYSGSGIGVERFREVLLHLLDASRSLLPRLQDIRVALDVDLDYPSCTEDIQQNMDLVARISQELGPATFTLALSPAKAAHSGSPLTLADVVADLSVSCANLARVQIVESPPVSGPYY